MRNEIPVIIIKDNVIQEVIIKSDILKCDEVKICEGTKDNPVGILKGEFVVLSNEKIKEYRSHLQDLSHLWLLEFVKYEFSSKSGWKLKKIGNLEERGREGKISLKLSSEKGEDEKMWLTDENPFENYAGKSEIVFENNKKILKIPIEVVSRKLLPNGDREIKTGSSLFYPIFLRNIVEEIWDLINALPFNIETPAFISASLSTKPSHPLFVFFFLKNYKEDLKTALNVIRANPYRILFDEKEFVDISEGSEIDNDTIYNILTHPEYLYDTTESKTGFLVSHVSEGRYYTPLKILHPVRYETLDNPENRFVMYFIRLLLQDIVKFEEKHKEYVNSILDLKGELENFIKDPLWEEVGELVIFPSTSTVLRMRDGYREFFQLYIKYLFARKPFKQIEEAIDLRRIYELYEFWCAFKLCKVFDVKNIELTIKQKIPENFELKGKFNCNDEEMTFEYQKSKKSYTDINLIPDFSIVKDNEPYIIFDAKFGFNTPMIEKESSSDDEFEKAEKENRFPKTGDIIKMHAYKDALKSKACFVLYPGNKNNFYTEKGEKYENSEIKNIKEFIEKLIKEDIKGVGWIYFLPEEKERQKMSL